MPFLRFKKSVEALEVEKNFPLRHLSKHPQYGWSFVCRGGVCGGCLMEVIEGMENLSHPSEAEKAYLASIHAGPHQRLACLCLILDGEVIVDW